MSIMKLVRKNDYLEYYKNILYENRHYKMQGFVFVHILSFQVNYMHYWRFNLSNETHKMAPHKVIDMSHTLWKIWVLRVS